MSSSRLDSDIEPAGPGAIGLTRLLGAWPLLAIAFSIATSGCSRETKDLRHDASYYDRDIHTKMFTPDTGPSGEPVMTACRPMMSPASFARTKKAGTTRIFVLGGSVAAQFVPRWEDGLRTASPGPKLETVGCGMSGYDSPRELLALEELLDYSPDLVVLMSGNNERGDFDLRSSPLWSLAREGRMTARTAARRMLWIWRESLRARWDLFLARRRKDSQLPRRRIFERTLRSMVRLARKRGVPIVACTLPRNYRDMPPRKTLPLGDKGFFDAWEAWERKDLEAAIRLLRAYLQRQPEQPHAHYLLARAMESAGNASAALSSYVKAVDLEGALPSLNAVARKVCLEEGCILADVEASFNALNPNGLADGFCFDDEMHWDRFCDPLVTKTIEKAVCDHDARHGKSVLAERLPWDQAALGRALTLTPTADALRRKKWEIFMIRVWNEWEDEERYFERVIAHFDHMRLLDPGMVSNVSGLRDFLRTAFQSNRWDRTLADNVDRWWPQMLRHVGEMYRRNGQDELALRYFDETALLAPGPRLFRLSRALALSKLGRDKEAWAELDQLAALEKRFKEIRYYRETLANARRDAPRTRAAMPPPGRMIRASRRLKQQEEIEALRKEARRILEAPRH